METKKPSPLKASNHYQINKKTETQKSLYLLTNQNHNVKSLTKKIRGSEIIKPLK